MRTADWPAVITAKTLLVGENSTLQWKDEVLEHAMFLDYYFNHPPSDLGERSRYSEAKAIFEALSDMSCGECRAEEVHGSLLSNALLPRPPKGKRILIPVQEAKDGVEHICGVLKRNPTIKYVFVMGLQANLYLQKLGFYSCGEMSERFFNGAQPRRVGVNSFDPYYQPVDAKPFREICFKRFEATNYPGVVVIPILPVKSYPLSGVELTNFGDNYSALKSSFSKK
ncbi:MAG: hypothetical protein R3Y39_01275 [Rikenellaceae bacterium]